jgi:hypothetical protein
MSTRFILVIFQPFRFSCLSVHLSVCLLNRDYMYMLMGFNVAFESCDVGSENRTCTAMHCTPKQSKARAKASL